MPKPASDRPVEHFMFCELMKRPFILQEGLFGSEQLLHVNWATVHGICHSIERCVYGVGTNRFLDRISDSMYSLPFRERQGIDAAGKATGSGIWWFVRCMSPSRP